MKKMLDKTFVGVLTGIIFPPIAFYIFSLYSYHDINVVELLKSYADRHLLTHIISLSALVNLPIFYGFLRLGSDRAAKGVVAATLFYFLFVLILKFK